MVFRVSSIIRDTPFRKYLFGACSLFTFTTLFSFWIRCYSFVVCLASSQQLKWLKMLIAPRKASSSALERPKKRTNFTHATETVFSRFSHLRKEKSVFFLLNENWNSTWIHFFSFSALFRSLFTRFVHFSIHNASCSTPSTRLAYTEMQFWRRIQVHNSVKSTSKSETYKKFNN